MKENREYRSDVFSMLMEEPQYALEVYNALNNTNYEDPSQVKIARLDGGISLSMRNDAAFILGTDFNLYEHQSTYNPNMPLRCLFYYSEIMQEQIKKHDLYGMRLIKVPTPHFVVFYNGHRIRPEIETMLFSSAFEKETDEPEIEVKVTVYNINCNNNVEFMERCGVLREYMYLVDKVQEYVDEGNTLENAIPKAISRCIDEHVLEDFLRERKGEVADNMKLDYTWERREVLIREEEHAAGHAEGKAEGKAEGMAEGHADYVRKLKSKGMDTNTIAELLDITVQEVEVMLA